MLVEATSNIKGFINFINNLNLTDKICKVVVLPEHDCVGEGDNVGFAAYAWGEGIMYVAGNFDNPALEDLTEEEKEQIILGNIAHEYIHHVQWAEDMDPDEEEAEKKAIILIHAYKYTNTSV